MLSEALLVSAPGKVILHGEHAVVHGKVKSPQGFEQGYHFSLTLNLKKVKERPVRWMHISSQTNLKLAPFSAVAEDGS